MGSESFRSEDRKSPWNTNHALSQGGPSRSAPRTDAENRRDRHGATLYGISCELSFQAESSSRSDSRRDDQRNGRCCEVADQEWFGDPGFFSSSFTKVAEEDPPL